MGEKLSKLKNVYHKYGAAGFVKKLFRYADANVVTRLGAETRLHPDKVRRQIRQMLAEDYDRVILWRSSFGYQVPLFQRPQHIARCLTEGRSLVLYEVTTMTDPVRTLRRQSERLWLVDLNNAPFRKLLMEELEKVEKPKYLQIYSTNWEMPLSELLEYRRKGFHVLYEYIDDLSPEVRGTATLPKNISDKYDYVMAHPDCTVVVTAELLRQDVLAHRGGENLAFSSNGVDYAFFQSFGEYAFDPDFQAVLDRGKPIVCYYGALAKWFDYELVKKLSATGKYSVVLFGVKYDESFDEHLRGQEDIYFLGPRDYQALKYYAREAAVLMIPFLINDVTRATSPLKVFEYMALHKPIVTTDMDECRRYRSVLIGHDHEEFLAQVERAMALREDAAYLALLDEEASANDWHAKAAAIEEQLRRAEERA